MLILSLLPVFFLWAPANFTGIIITLLLLSGGCFVAIKYDLYQIKALERKTLLIAIAAAILRGIYFVNIWLTSSKMASLAEILHLPLKTFIIVIGICLSAAAVWGHYNIISIIKNISRIIPEDKPLKSNDFYPSMKAENSADKENQFGRSFFILTLILLLQLVMMVYFGNQKAGYHCDEIYTYELSNSSETSINSGDCFDAWNSSEYFLKTLSADADNRFDYVTVWKNQRNDVHPPFYYVIVHTVSSLFPNVFSKWIGLIPSFIFSLLTTIVLFYVAKRIFKNDALALLTAGGWALSVGAMSAAVFIRMYAMLSFFCTLLILQHLKFANSIGNKPTTFKAVYPLFLCTLSGILTQYYFMVFCLFFCGLFFFELLWKKQRKSAYYYVVAEFGAIFTAYIIFPAMFNHIFSGYRGKQAFAYFLSRDDYSSRLKLVLTTIADDSIGRIPLFVVISLAVLCAMVLFFRSNSRKKILSQLLGTFSPILTLCITGIGYILLITRVAPLKSDRYYMCVYPALAILIVYSVSFIWKIFIKKEASIILSTSVIFIGLTTFNYLGNSVNYIFPEWEDRAVLSEYSGSKAVVLNSSIDFFAISNYAPEYINYSEVFVCNRNGFSSLEHINIDDLDYRFLLYAYEFGGADSENEMFEKVQTYLPVKSFDKLTDVSCPVYLCTLES